MACNVPRKTAGVEDRALSAGSRNGLGEEPWWGDSFFFFPAGIKNNLFGDHFNLHSHVLSTVQRTLLSYPFTQIPSLFIFHCISLPFMGMYADWFICVAVYPLLLIFFWMFETELQTWHEIALERPSVYLSPNHIMLHITTVRKYKWEDLCVYSVILQSQTPFRFHQLSWQPLFPLWSRLPTRTWHCVPLSRLLCILYLRQFLRLPTFHVLDGFKEYGFSIP